MFDLNTRSAAFAQGLTRALKYFGSTPLGGMSVGKASSAKRRGKRRREEEGVGMREGNGRG